MTYNGYALGYPCTILAAKQGSLGTQAPIEASYLEGSKLQGVSITQSQSTGLLNSISLTWYGKTASDISPALVTTLAPGASVAPSRASFTIPAEAVIFSIEALRLDAATPQGKVSTVAGFTFRWKGSGGGVFSKTCAVDGWASSTFGAVPVPNPATPVGFAAYVSAAGLCTGWQWQWGSLPILVSYISLQPQAATVSVPTTQTQAVSGKVDTTAQDPLLNPPAPGVTGVLASFVAKAPYAELDGVLDAISSNLVQVPISPACISSFQQTFTPTGTPTLPPIQILIEVGRNLATSVKTSALKTRESFSTRDVPLGTVQQMKLTGATFTTAVPVVADATGTYTWNDLRGGQVKQTLSTTLEFAVKRAFGWTQTIQDVTPV